ncbi:MAG: aminotransferase [Gemmatimonadetes bacterium]|nr:aminotransferase [Gemmatimonadota bacterium]
MTVYFNGSYQPKDAVRVSPDDRGFLLGDGVYEVARTYGGRLFAIDRHLERLRYSLGELRITGVAVDTLGQVFEELLRINGLMAGDALVYFQVTRGAARRAHGFPEPPVAPTTYGYAAPLALKFDHTKGVAAITVPDRRWARCDIKTISLVANCLANQEAQEAGAFEAILVRDGVALEGSHTNLFAVLGGEVWTAPLSNYILPGITRAILIGICRAAGMPVHERPIQVEEIRRADEVFLAGTTTEALGVVRLDGRPVGTGVPGPVTLRLRQLFLKETARR